MNLLMKQEYTHRHTKQTYCYQDRGGGGGWMDCEFGINRCQLLYKEWINNKVQLYSTGNYIQHPVINHNGKEYKKNIHIYVQLNQFAIYQKVTQYYKSTMFQLKKFLKGEKLRHLQHLPTS